MKNISEKLIYLHKILDEKKIVHKIIGGFALAAYGVPRATVDIDFLVDAKDQMRLKEVMISEKFKVFFESDEVVQFEGAIAVDFLLSRRPISKKMLTESSKYYLEGISVVDPEDFIGLKIQAYKNNPKRAFQDKADIQKVIEAIENLDWNKIKIYAEAFDEWKSIENIRNSLRE